MTTTRGRNGCSSSIFKAWDVNCTQHIQPRYTAEEMQPMVEELRRGIAELEAKNAALEARLAVEEVGARV